MRPYDRDFYMSTISVLMEHNRLVSNITKDMLLRLDELQDVIAMQADQKEEKNFNSFVDEVAKTWGDIMEEDKIIYDSSRKKHCLCDACWNVPSDKYEHRMD